MKKKKQWHPLWFLCMLPGGAILDLGILYLGVLLDRWLMSNSTGLGHSFPIFTILSMILAIMATLTIIIMMIVLMVSGFCKRKKDSEK